MNGKTIKNRIVRLFVIAAAVLSMIFVVAACGGEEKKGASVKLELDTAAVQTSFGEGDEFSAEGLKVVAVIGEKRYIATHADYEITAPNMNKPGKKKITVKFMGASASYEITVINVDVTALSVDTANARTEFVQGDEFSAAGLIVTPTLSYGENKPLKHSECKFTGFDSETVGEQVITVSYRGASATYKVNVVALAPKSIKFDVSKVKAVYGVGEAFDKTGLTATITMNNGDMHDVTELDVQSKTFDAAGNTEVSVTAEYDGKPISGKINACVLPIKPDQYAENRVLEFASSDAAQSLSLYITEIKGGGKNSEAAETTGWTVLRNPDGSTVMNEFAYTYTPTDYKSTFVKCVGNASIVENGELQIAVNDARFTVADNVWHYVVIGWDELEYLSVDATKAKTTYFVGETFDSTGIVVMLHRMSGATETLEKISSDVAFAGFNGASAGSQEITVTYMGKTAKYNVSVEAVELENIELDYSNVKTSYFVGEEFTTSGLIVTAVMNNGTRNKVEIADCNFSGYDLTAADSYNVTVSYGGKSATYPITVVEPQGVLKAITLNTSAVKTEFEAGDVFVATGLTVTAEFEDGSNKPVEISACTFTGYDMNAVGRHTVTVTYGGKTATYEINVNSATLQSISVDYAKAKREYVVNGTFSHDGLVVTAHFANGTTSKIEAGAYGVSSPDMSTVGVKTVTVSYGGKTAEYMIYAIPEVDWSKRKLDFGNVSGTSDTLELFVTEIEGGGDWGKAATTKGWYLLKRSDGTYAMFEFRFGYVPDRTPQCRYSTQGLDKEYHDDDQQGALFVVIGNLTFSAGASYWHHIVMGWQM